MSFLSNLFGGSPAKHKRVSTLMPNQQGIQEQLSNAAQGAGAGGAFGQAADYYRNNLSDNPQDFQNFANPQMRQFNEEIIPGLSEQFAGMGAGGLSSSGFRNAAVNAGTDLSERLANLRAQLRQNSAQGLQNIGQQSLGNFSQDVQTQPGTEGLASQFAPAIGTAIGSFAGPLGSAAGSAIGNQASNWISGKGKSDPYGGQAQAPKQTQLPTFLQR